MTSRPLASVVLVYRNSGRRREGFIRRRGLPGVWTGTDGMPTTLPEAAPAAYGGGGPIAGAGGSIKPGPVLSVRRAQVGYNVCKLVVPPSPRRHRHRPGARTAGPGLGRS